MNKEIKPNSALDFIATLLLLTIFFIGGIFAWKIIQKQNSNNITPPVIIEPQPSEYPDFEQTKSLNKEIILSNFESWTPNSEVLPENVSTTIIVDKGTVVKGYIYIRASLADKALSQWESVYLKFNDAIGGHIFRPNSLPIPAGAKTELLYPLNGFSYLPNAPYSDKRTPSEYNLLPLFQGNAEIKLTAFISSLRKAKIEEITLYYECQESDVECSVKVKN